ncbi:MAG: endolytic transglycosylase MltG [Bacteroidales bacterium]
MKKVRAFLTFLLLIAVAACAVAVLLYTRTAQPYKGYAEPEQFVELAPRSSTRAIGARLVEAGVVRDTLTFRLAVWRSVLGRQLKAGEYRFDRPMSALDVIAKIARGEVFLRPITFPEGLSLDDMAALFATRGFGTAAEFRQAAGEVDLVKDVDPQAKDLEGYLFPETYTLPRRAQAPDLVRLMVRRFDQVFAALGPDPTRGAEASLGRPLSLRQFVTLASIVEKETGNDAERPMVAAVYLNRLRIGMPLQCDPTVIYGLRRAGAYNGNLTHENLASDSPYNTYVHPGLPPGPIASPGKSSLEAVARPAHDDFLYFVSRNDGTHEFARTLEEHNRNVFKYQKQYFREKRAQLR